MPVGEFLTRIYDSERPGMRCWQASHAVVLLALALLTTVLGAGLQQENLLLAIAQSTQASGYSPVLGKLPAPLPQK